MSLKMVAHPCRECRTCGHYGFDCVDPVTEAEARSDKRAFGRRARPDCWERDEPDERQYPHDEEDGISSDHLDTWAFESREGSRS